jgi:hypothetical protein
MQRLSVPGESHSEDFALPVAFASAATFLDTATFLVIGAGDYSVYFLDRYSLKVKGSYEFKGTDDVDVGRRLYDVEHDSVIVRQRLNETYLVSPHSAKQLFNFPADMLTVVRVSEDHVLVLVNGEFICYNLNTYESYTAGHIDSVSAYPLKLSKHSFSVKLAWHVAVLSRGGVYTTRARLLENYGVREFMKSRMNPRDVTLVGDTYYFFSMSGVIAELSRKDLQGEFFASFAMWASLKLREKGIGFGHMHPNIWRRVVDFLH